MGTEAKAEGSHLLLGSLGNEQLSPCSFGGTIFSGRSDLPIQHGTLGPPTPPLEVTLMGSVLPLTLPELCRGPHLNWPEVPLTQHIDPACLTRAVASPVPCGHSGWDLTYLFIAALPTMRVVAG